MWMLKSIILVELIMFSCTPVIAETWSYDHRKVAEKKISYDPKAVPAAAGEYTVIAWNDLGIHCMDDDFAISSTLPPFQVLWAQVIHKTAKEPVVITGEMVEDPKSPYYGLTVEYSFPKNTSERFLSGPKAGQPKSNYWDYAARYFGAHPAGLYIEQGKQGPMQGKKLLHVDNDLADDVLTRLPDGSVKVDEHGTPGRGLTGLGLSGKMTPYAFHKNMHVDAKKGLTMDKPIDAFVAEGFPLTKWNDDGSMEEYQVAEIVVMDRNGKVLAKTKTVAGISDEMHCSDCHDNNGKGNEKISSAGDKLPAPDATLAQVAGGTAKMIDVAKNQQYKLNILKLHDLKYFKDAKGKDVVVQGVKGYDNTVYDYLLRVGTVDAGNALGGRGKHMSESGVGLYKLSKSGIPILCAACHRSNGFSVPTGDALEEELAYLVNNDDAPANDYKTRKTVGAPIGQYTHSIHAKHDKPTQNCYLCHPGKVTDCLRGTMEGSQSSSLFIKKVALKEGEYPEPESNRVWCSDCHGDNKIHPGHPMAAVGDPKLRQVEEGPYAGTGSQPWLVEPRCGGCHKDHPENSDAPYKGISLFRFSKGHGGIYCEACHGSTHAIQPTNSENYNIQPSLLQGETGSLYQCAVCHKEEQKPENGEKFIHHEKGDKPFGTYSDIHTESGVTCGDCHNRLERMKAAGKWEHDAKFGSNIFVPKKLTKRQSIELCGGCHERFNKPNNTMREYAEGEHGKKLLAKNKEDAAGCIDCHGDHRVRRVKDPMSKVAKGNDMKTCGKAKCHTGGKMTKKHRDVKGYKETLAPGETYVDTCVTCHGGHRIDKKGKGKL